MHELKSHPNDAAIVNHVFVTMAGLIKTSGNRTCALSNNYVSTNDIHTLSDIVQSEL